MERDQGNAPAAATADPGYERAILRLEAALDLALSDGVRSRGAGEVQKHLDAARREIDRVRASRLRIETGGELALARMLALRIAANPGLSLTSQKPRGEIALKSLLND